MFKLKNILLIFKSDLFIPILILFFYIGFIFFVKKVLPSGDELISTFENFYANFGYPLIFIAAFLECLILVNFFVPGVVVMALGAILASSGKIELSLVILCASIGAILGYIVDYFLGIYGIKDLFKKFGMEKIIETARNQIHSLGAKGLFIGFCYPATGAITGVSSGMIKYSFLKYLITCVISVFFWMSVWGILFFSLGQIMLPLITNYSYLILGLIVAAFFIIKLVSKKNVPSKL